MAPIESRPDSPVPKRVKWSMDHPPPFKETDPPPEDSVQKRASDTQNAKTDKTKRDTKEHRLTPEEAELRSFLRRKFQHLVEGVPHQGDPTLLRDIYTDLYIIERGVGMVIEEHEVRQIERASLFYYRCSGLSDDEEGEESGDIEGEDDSDIEGEEDSDGGPIKCSDIFKPLYTQKGLWQLKPIRVVLTKGVAGIGKTVSVQKFILDWTEGETNQDIHFIFPLPFRELNLLKNTKLSLVELIQHCFTEVKDLKVLSSFEYKILFIFDGLDECRLPLDFQSNPRCCDVTEPASVDVLLTNLINGNLLPSALLWVTTRPAAAGQIPLQCVDQVTEIRGFNDSQKDDYFKKRISDENLARRVIRHLKSFRSLYIMCHIPVFSWILASVAERTLGTGEVPRTLTQMYIHFLNIQTCIKKEKYTEREETDEEMVFKLGKLAFQQLEKGNLIFYEEDLRESDIDVTEASLYSGVCTQIFREEAELCHGRLFSFVHLSIQEFLAALYVFLCFCNSVRNIAHQHQPSQLSALFRAATLQDLLKTAVDLAFQSRNGHLDLFLRFLLGLSMVSNQKLLRHLLTNTQANSQPRSLEQTVQYVKNKIGHWYDSEREINLLYCLNELNQHAVVEQIDRRSGALILKMLLPGEWETRWFRFGLSEEQLDGFDLQKYMKTPEEDLTDLLSPEDILKKLFPVFISMATSAELEGCYLTEKTCAAIAAAARSSSCSLKMLDLSHNVLHDEGVQQLSDLLKDPQCKLVTLELQACSLTEKSCAAIAAVARSTSCSLKTLDLSHNELHDEGVQHLSDLLKDPQCKVASLELRKCSLTEKSCAAIAAAAISTSCSLTLLDLGYNDLHDVGVQHLSDLLKDPQCILETLVLQDCSLTEKSCAAIAAAARSTSHSLKMLDLSGNAIHDTGVQHLLDILKDPQCKLEALVLQGCSLTDNSCAAIAAAASSTSCSLKMLDLTGNYLYGFQLSHLLRDPQCKLNELIMGTLVPTPRGASRKEYPVTAAAAAARFNSFRSSDAALLHLTHSTQQLPGAQLLSPHTPTEDGPSDDTQRGCKCCAEVPDASHWVLVEPEVFTGKTVSIYSLSSAAGSYECSESSLRWSCVGPVTLQYRFMDWQVFAEELAHMQCSPAGPLMDIKLKSGELEEIHLPHFLCLGGSQSALKDAVTILHQQSGGVCLEKCELSRSHARLLNPSLSIFGVVKYVKSILFSEKEESKMEIHTYVDIYKSSILPLTFRVYLMPTDAHLKRLVEEQEKLKEFGGIRLPKPRPVECLQLNQLYALHTDCHSTILPPKLKLEMAGNLDTTPNFSEVRLKKPGDFRVTLLSFADSQEVKKEVWQAEILGIECWSPYQDTLHVYGRGPISTLPCGVDTAYTPTPVDQSSGCQDIQTPECSSRVLQDTVDVADFLKKKMSDLIQRVTNVMQLADAMLSEDLIKAEQYREIDAKPTDQSKMRCIFDALRSCGPPEKKKFFQILQDLHPSLLQELGCR